MIKLMAKRIKRIRRHLDDWKNDIYGVVQAEFEPDVRDASIKNSIRQKMHASLQHLGSTQRLEGL